MEKLLIQHRLAEPQHIVGIQKAGAFHNYKGRDVLRQLTRSIREVPFAIFVKDFVDFARYYGPQFSEDMLEAEKAAELGAQFSFGKWIERNATAKFSIANIDLCCPFHKPAAQAICSLFSSSLLGSNGLLFITHMRGREKPKDKNFIGSRAGDCRQFWYISVPCYYTEQVSKVGYRLEVKRVVEYREEPPAQPMICYAFEFKKDPTAVIDIMMTGVRNKLKARVLVPSQNAEGKENYEDGRFTRHFVSSRKRWYF
jgi:hypothetical protein